VNLELSQELTLGINSFGTETKKGIFQVTSVVVKFGARKAKVKLLVIDDVSISIPTLGIEKAASELKAAGYRLSDKYLNGDVIEDIGIVISALHFSLLEVLTSGKAMT